MERNATGASVLLKKSKRKLPSCSLLMCKKRLHGRLPLLAFCLLPVCLLFSSFTYREAVSERTLQFPRDHFSHPDFKTEWWYYTGHLETAGGGSYGYQLTFFRFGLRNRQEEAQGPLFTDLYMGHFAISDRNHKKMFFRDRVNRGYQGRAGARVDRYLVWNEDWKVEEKDGSHILYARDRDRVLSLRLTPLKAAVLHGKAGLSQKGEGRGRASYYYSFTRLETEGVLEISGKKMEVRGLSWMDHEFGSDQLGENQVGWDWFGLQLGNGAEIMLYLIRHGDGSVDPHSSGTLVREDGTSHHLALKDFSVEALEQWKSPQSGGVYPMRWKVSIPAEGIELEVSPSFPGQELDTRKSTRVTYWEGSVEIQGAYGGKPVGGLGYVEMTGYAGRLRL